MTENNKVVDELSFEYFLNKDTYGKYLEKYSIEKKNNFKKEKRFYRKRIYDITKQLLNDDYSTKDNSTKENSTKENYNKDIYFAFDMYTRVCIEYFKMLDKNDILQEDYSTLLNNTSEINNNPQIDINNLNNNSESDKLLMRSIKITEPNSLEKLVKRKSTKNIKKDVHLPIQKNIDLKDPIFKKKGIKEKEKKKDDVKNVRKVMVKNDTKNMEKDKKNE
jgi:hypothetical protein